ncbi:MAG: hypothetical protein AUH85_02970 [Chloroflexi bacterium 13_1_40CM_4_68_4]|nr:MAG: hypothetical protein AUH85_02970 [Chloroflexi bacterium 13_1_40CM_4_68_4]
MGFDEPIDHWAPPDSLDPTPVWKQYLLVVLLGSAIFLFGAIYAYVAFLPDLVTPPAALPGRVVLGALQYAPGTTQKVTIAGPDETFYLTYARGVPLAVRATWSPTVSVEAQCRITLVAEDPLFDPATGDAVFLDSCTHSVFGASGDVLAGSAPRGLDRYLVARKGDRLIVNTDHLIQGTP